MSEHIPEACVDCLAGHRIDREHDCFAMNCKDLGPEVEMLRERIVRLDLIARAAQDWMAADDARSAAAEWRGPLANAALVKKRHLREALTGKVLGVQKVVAYTGRTDLEQPGVDELVKNLGKYGEVWE